MQSWAQLMLSSSSDAIDNPKLLINELEGHIYSNNKHNKNQSKVKVNDSSDDIERSREDRI